MSLSIHLLPEFGWSLRDRPVFGPGSVFQGHVELHLQQPLVMDRLRLVFQGQECLVPFDVTPGVVRAKSVPLFGIQQTLWDSKDGLQSLDAGTYKYPFTIQMPMVQYPPSTCQDSYKCTFNLIAVAESQHQSKYTTLIIKELEMLYMPFVETRLMKKRLVSTQQQSDLQVTTKLHSLDYVPGDTILGSLTVTTLPTSSPSSKKSLDVSLKLYRTVTNLYFDDVPAITQVVASTSTKLSPVECGKGTPTVYSSSALELDIPDDLVPTFTYSKLASVTYRLALSVKRKGPLAMWAQEVAIDWPLTIGTLGAGVRSSSDLMIYSALDSTVDSSQQLRPRFMKAVEYEDALPLYEPSRLPAYQVLSPSIVV
ncbi:hypothetical protein [Absidia glauca]|uniref:Arrestin C-terminal-like domain-containing protein n=1 Tax=Absidia glauca TaxID=4829 RepID=A0A168NTV9_ABSGL|nr:hypothetical protein [Absidia glauca]